MNVRKLMHLHVRTVAVVLTGILAWQPSASYAQSEYAFRIARVKYGGGGDWYSDPQSLKELLSFVRQRTNIDVSPREEVVEASSDDLFSFPYLYLTGHGNVPFK